MTTFAELGLSDAVLAAVDHLGYTEPTPVQAQAIPLVLQGRDIIAAAKTGTGKTAAFSLPSLDVLARAERKKAPAMLVITPTRELAMQIQEVCQTIARTRGLRVANVVGGVKIEPQIDRLARGVDVLIATPGRLIDLMNQKAVDLSQVQVLVLDEADGISPLGAPHRGGDAEKPPDTSVLGHHRQGRARPGGRHAGRSGHCADRREG